MSNFDGKAISKKISPMLNKIQKSKLANGISGGMMVAMPVTLFGAFAALFLNLQIPAWKGFIAATGIAYALNVAIMFSTNFLAPVFGLTIASSYAKQYKEDGTVPTLLALVCFFIVTPFTTDKGGTTLSMYWLGAPGIFSAIIISLISTRVYIYLKQKGITIKMPSTVPPVVSGSFSSLIPGFAAIAIFIAVAALFAATPFKTMHQFIYNFIQMPLQGVGGNIVSIIILWTFAQILWFFGIHGTLVIYSVMMPIFAAKSKQYKTLGKLTAVPSLFGISEPLVFGTPLVFNFKFVIPFVFMNAINITIAYFLTAVGIVPRVAGMTPMSGMPIIFSGLMEGSWKIAVLQVLLVGLSTLVWYPFFRKADKEAYELEQNTENQ